MKPPRRPPSHPSDAGSGPGAGTAARRQAALRGISLSSQARSQRAASSGPPPLPLSLPPALDSAAVPDDSDPGQKSVKTPAPPRILSSPRSERSRLSVARDGSRRTHTTVADLPAPIPNITTIINSPGAKTTSTTTVEGLNGLKVTVTVNVDVNDVKAPPTLPELDLPYCQPSAFTPISPSSPYLPAYPFPWPPSRTGAFPVVSPPVNAFQPVTSRPVVVGQRRRPGHGR